MLLKGSEGITRGYDFALSSQEQSEASSTAILGARVADDRAVSPIEAVRQNYSIPIQSI